MTNEHQIESLNAHTKLKLAPSSIHGIGVFAIRDVMKGDHLYADKASLIYTLGYNHFSKLFPEVKDLILERWPQIVNGSAFVFPDARMLAYMNHSDDPNYDSVDDVALRDIKAGEEITEDYRNIENWELVYPWITSVDKT